MTLPRLCLIADGFVSGRAGQPASKVAARAVAAVEAGVPWVALRDTNASDAAFLSAVTPLVVRLREARPDLILSVHGRLDAAQRLGAVYHATHRGPGVAEAVAAGLPLVGASVHAPVEATTAAHDGAAYVFLSPVWPTGTHSHAPPLGLHALAEASAGGVPVLALGGVTPTRAAEAVAAGAHGVAVLSALLDAPDLASAVAAFLAALT